MRKHLRRYAVGALAIGAIAGGTTIALPGTTLAMDWRPVTYGLNVTPASLLPATVSAQDPVRVVSTALDQAGRPVVTVATATDKAAAEAYVKKGQTARNAIGVELDAVTTAADVPAGTDTYRAQQWDFTKIHVADAWRRSTGSGVVVAVLDTGVDASHPDLAGQVLAGANMVTDTTGTSTDPNGHGTHVAGTIAATTGNAAGISAIAPDTKILPVTVLGSTGSGYMSDTAEGIVWAADHGATVINMSLGSASQVSAVTNAVAYARGKGVVVVAAAGNDRAKGSPVSYPGADPGVIAVAATDANDAIASYSNAGGYVDVAAPGSNILSTVPAAKGNYAYYSGTSMASPHVAAVAALLKGVNKALTPDQVQGVLESTSVDLGAKGKDTDFGYGRIDALAAVTAVSPTPSATTTAPSPTAPTSTVPTTSVPAPVTKTPTVAPTTVAPTTAAPSPTKTVSPTPTPSPTKTVSPTPTTKVAPVKKVTPVIRAAASSTSIVYGGTGTVTFTVTASDRALASVPVQIGVTQPGGTTFGWTDTVTDAAGRVVFAGTITGRTQVKLNLPATPTTVAVSTSAVTFSATARVTLTGPAPKTLKVALVGAAGQKVQVERDDRSRWTVVKTYTAEPATTVTGLAAGTYRVVVPTTTAVTGVVSGTIEIS